MSVGTGVADRALGDLADTKAALTRLLARRAAAPPGPTPRPIGAEVPATPVQARLWAAERTGAEAAHVGVHGLHLRGRLDVGRLQEALCAVVARHESLRTAVRSTPTGLRQVVTGAASPVLQRDDLTRLATDARTRALADAHAVLGADLTLRTGATTRFHIVRVDADEHRFLLASHLGVFDGWSSAVFAEDLAAAYRGERLAPPALQAGDVAVWQQRWLAGTEAAEALDQLLRPLRDGQDVSGTPLPRARPAHHARRRHLPVSLAPTRTGPAFRLGAQEGATPFMTLVAALAAVLARRTGQTHVVLGTPVAGRDFGGAEDVVGQLTTAVPLVVDCSDRPTLRVLLRRVRSTCAVALASQRIPLDVLAEHLRAAGLRAPAWSVLLALHNYPDATLRLPGIEVAVRPGPPTHHLNLYGAPDPFAVGAMLGFIERDGHVSGTVEHHAGMGDPVEVLALIDAISRVLQHGAADPDAPVL